MQKYIYKILVLSAFFSYNATASASLVPRNIHIGMDIYRLPYYGGLINMFNKLSYIYESPRNELLKQSCPKYSGMQYEFNVGVNYRVLSWNIDFGLGSTSWEGNFDEKVSGDDVRWKSKYESSGFYVKYGLDFNLLVDTYENNAAYLGVRHTISFFSDKGEGYIIHKESELIKDSDIVDIRKINLAEGRGYVRSTYDPVSVEQKGLIANWFEVIAGVRLKMKSFMYVGCNLRYKFFLSLSKFPMSQPYDILGWGLFSDSLDKTALGYNFYIHFVIPISKQAPHDRKNYKNINDRMDVMAL